METSDVARTPTIVAVAEQVAPGTFDGDRLAAVRKVGRSLDQALRDLRRANIAFNTPETLRLDDTSVVDLLMSHRVPIPELQDRLKGVGDSVGASIRASDVMEANLTGLDFKIEDITPLIQPVVRKGVTQWKWEVEPTEVGRRRLHLTLTALIEVDGDETEYAVRTFERTLTVESVPVAWHQEVTGFVGGNLPWLAPSVFVPTVVALYRRRRKPSNGETASPAAAGDANGDRGVADP